MRIWPRRVGAVDGGEDLPIGEWPGQVRDYQFRNSTCGLGCGSPAQIERVASVVSSAGTGARDEGAVGGRGRLRASG